MIRDEGEWSIDVDELDDQMRSLGSKIRKLKNPEATRDLGRMFRNIETLRESMSREAVRCRGLNRTTGTMQNLQKDIDQTIGTLEQLLVLALLIE